jgi:DNA-binding GntR family transcriptional regulator
MDTKPPELGKRGIRLRLKAGGAPLSIVPKDHGVTDRPFADNQGSGALLQAEAANRADAIAVRKCVPSHSPETRWTASREREEAQVASGVPPASNASEFPSAYAKLKWLIITNQFSPNEHLQINYLAERLAVGVTPAREALIRLSVEGLITVHAKRGFFAKLLTVDELCQLYHLAFLLLRYNVQWDGGRPGVKIAGTDITSALCGTQSDRPAALALAIEQLHEQIAVVGGNAQMAKVIRNYNCRTHAVRLIYVEQAENAESMVAYIRTMINLLELDDREALVAELERNFDTKIAHAPKLIKELAAQACSADWKNHHFRSSIDFAQRCNGLSAGAR